MAMEIMNKYGGYGAQGVAESSAAKGAQKKETDKAAENSSKSESTAEYMSRLEKLAPSVKFRAGDTFATAKTGKTLTISPALLQKMQNDPEKEKEMKELIRGVESMTRLMNSIHAASGWKTVYRHSYIDENGKYCHIAYIRNEFGYKMSEKLREERRENSEKLIEKIREKAVKNKGELQYSDETADRNKVEQLLEEKFAESKNGIISVNDTEMRAIMEAMKEQEKSRAGAKEQKQTGLNVDLQI